MFEQDFAALRYHHAKSGFCMNCYEVSSRVKPCTGLRRIAKIEAVVLAADEVEVALRNRSYPIRTMYRGSESLDKLKDALDELRPKEEVSPGDG